MAATTEGVVEKIKATLVVTRQGDVEMTSPQNAYNNRGADSGFAPPPGPPPNKV